MHLVFPLGVNCWGHTGHQLVASVASRMFNEIASEQVKYLIGDGNDFINASSWADTIRRHDDFKFSAVLHYVGTKDSPSSNCSYDDDRDCHDGKCVVGAITNYTEQAMCGNNLDKDRRAIATKFVEHFIGDISQPLHVCGREKGGNGVNITFDGNITNLHSIWDTEMIEKHLLLDFQGNFTKYEEHIFEIALAHNDWVPTKDIFAKNHNGNSFAAIELAIDSNSMDCEMIWGVYDSDPTQDFGSNYYENVISLIDNQLAKGARRLATWFNRMFASCQRPKCQSFRRSSFR